MCSLLELSCPGGFFAVNAVSLKLPVELPVSQDTVEAVLPRVGVKGDGGRRGPAQRLVRPANAMVLAPPFVATRPSGAVGRSRDRVARDSEEVPVLHNPAPAWPERDAVEPSLRAWINHTHGPPLRWLWISGWRRWERSGGGGAP